MPPVNYFAVADALTNNITPWSAHFRQLIDISKLKDVRRGFGIFPTWPASTLPLLIPIDHILIAENMKATQVGTGNLMYSDHRSFWADVRFN